MFGSFDCNRSIGHLGDLHHDLKSTLLSDEQTVGTHQHSNHPQQHCVKPALSFYSRPSPTLRAVIWKKHFQFCPSEQSPDSSVINTLILHPVFAASVICHEGALFQLSNTRWRWQGQSIHTHISSKHTIIQSTHSSQKGRCQFIKMQLRHTHLSTGS